MSESNSPIERAIDETVDAAVSVAAPIDVPAPASVKTATANVADAVKKSAAKALPNTAKKKTPVVAMAAKAAKPAATPKPAAKRSYKPRVKAAATITAKVASKVSRKASATVTRRKYVRKATVAATPAASPQIKGTKTMSYEMPNMFAAMTSIPGADKFQAMFGDVSDKSQDAVRKTQAFAGQMTEAAKANVEAMVESTRIATAGARDLGQELLASGRTGVEQASTSVKSLVEAKSPTEFFQLHTELTKSSFDRMVAEGSKLTEQMVKLAGEAMQPLSNRASVNAEKLGELTA